MPDIGATAQHSESDTDVLNKLDWQYLWARAKKSKPQLIRAHLIALLATIASIPVPFLMPLMVDEVLLKQPGATVAFINTLFPDAWHGAVLYISVVLFSTLILRMLALSFNVLQGKQFTYIAKKIIYQIRRALLMRLQRISMAEYETLGGGTVAAHFVTDLNTLDQFIGSTVSRLLVSVLSIAGAAMVLLWMHWQLALLILFANPIVIYFTVVVGKRVKDLKKHENKAFEVFQQALTETLESIHQIRAANREQHYLSRLTEYARQVKDHSINFSWKTDAANRISFMIFLFGFDIFRAVSMLMVVFSGLSVGQMFAVFAYLWFMMGPVQEVLNIQYAWFAAKAAIQRINQLINLHEEPRYPHLENPFKHSESISIRFKNVHFSYAENQDVLNGVDLSIKAGQKIALVGASGGGKSTLVQVLLGLYTPQQGDIYFNNVPVTRIGMDVVRENIATVLQHPALFNDTVRNNLTMGRELGEAELWNALEIAQLKQTVLETESGLDTLVGRQGMRLSGGQRQRLAIARMILSNPKVVILDEATSALDAATEQQLHQAMGAFLKNRTTIIIAHRLSAVKQADHVYVFEDGKIIEQGAHQELMQRQGLYAKLYGEYQH